MAAHDGSIHIDTKINTAGINTGTAQINKAVEKNIAKPVQGLTKSLGGILNIIKGIGKALVAAFVGGAIFNFFQNLLQNIIQEFDFLTGSVGEKLKPLADALETLKGAFVNLLVQALIPLVPYLIQFINWLTTAVQYVTQLVAALFGFDKTVGGIMTKAASNAKKAAKEAKGALAAFDQINVLQQKQEPETPEGATATPEALSIADDILKKIANLKKLWDEFLKDPLGVLVAALIVAIGILQEKWREFVQWVRDNLPFGDVIADILTIIGDTFKEMFVNVIETIQNVKKNVELIFTGIKKFLTGVFTGDWKLALQGLVDIALGIFGVIGSIIEGIANHFILAFQGALEILKVLFAPVIEFLGAAFDRIKEKISASILSIQGVFATLAKWFFENVFNPIEAGFGSMLTGIKQGFTSTFNGIKDFVRGAVNNIIDFLNRMIDGVVSGINAVIGAANAIAGTVGLPELQSITAPKIPRLATGAVIPPNASFLAVLGDQKSGTNIEAPADLIRQIVREEVARGAGGGDVTVPIVLTLDGEVLHRSNQRVSKRHGTSLIKSGITR